MALTQTSEGGVKISNAGTNGQFLQKQSGNTGGLTWADVPAGVGGSTGADFNDNVKIRLGTGNDLQIYHDGSNSYIHDAGTGQLRISSDNFKVYNQAQNETIINGVENGAVSLYYDNSLKLHTGSDGISVTGVINNQHLRGGSGDMYAGNAAQGDLYIYVQDNTNNSIILQANTGEKYLEAKMGGAVDLYHHGSKKFETYASGIKSTGHILPAADNTYNLGAAGAAWAQINVGDHGELRFGNGQDFKIRHDGTDNHIASANGDININVADTETAAVFKPNGAAELYYDNVKKFETHAVGIKAISTTNECNLLLQNDARTWKIVNYDYSGSGGDHLGFHDGTADRLIIQNDGHVHLPADSQKLVFGTGDDLEIYHDGTDSVIDNNTGALHLKTNTAISILVNNSENAIVANANGCVDLYYDNSKKFETTSSGATVTGNLQLTNNLNLDDDKVIYLGDGDDLQIYHNGTNSLIENGTGELLIRAKTSENSINCNPDGAVELYYDNSKKAATAADGFTLWGNLNPYGNNAINIGANNNRVSKVYSDYLIHRHGQSGGVGQNESEAIYYRAGIHIFGDYVTMSNSNFTNGICGNRSYPLLAVHQNGSGAAIHAEDGAITEASDYRIKENVNALGSGIDKVKALKPITYTLKKSWKPTGNGEVYHGFIAHEVDETLSGITGIVCGKKDAMAPELYDAQDEIDGKIPEGKKVMDETGNMTNDMMIQSVDYGKLTPILTAALKEAIAKIETLETKVAALEAG